MKKFLALFLCAAMCFSLLPTSVMAEGWEETTVVDETDLVLADVWLEETDLSPHDETVPPEEDEAVDILPEEEFTPEDPEETPEEDAMEAPEDGVTEEDAADDAGADEISMDEEETGEELNEEIEADDAEAGLEEAVEDTDDAEAEEADDKNELAIMATSGTCGKNLNWTLDDGGTLTISGTGDMRNYTYSEPSPWGTNIKNVAIESGVTSIGDYAFYCCMELERITIPNGVTKIGKEACSSCSSLTDITLPDSVTRIGESAFRWCDGLTGVVLSNRLTSISDHAFYSCDSLTSITIPDSVASIEDWAFCACESLTSVTIPDSVTSIGERAFCGCYSLTSVTIPGSVTSMGELAFAKCESLTSVTLMEGMMNIGKYAFMHCKNLKCITIPGSVTSIGSTAFASCTALTNVMISTGVTSIGEGAFANCPSLASITIPGSVESIGNEAFSDCSSLTSVALLEGVKNIGDSVFLRCTSLTSTMIPGSVQSIGKYAFYECSSLKSLTISDGVESIGIYAFSYCTSLTSISIPDSVTRIGSGAFSRCTSVTSIRLPNSVETITGFGGCTSLTNVTIPEGVMRIGSGAFSECTGLTSVTIPISVSIIDTNAFSECTSLKSVYYLGTEDDWTYIQIDNDSGGNTTLLKAKRVYNYAYYTVDYELNGGVNSAENPSFYDNATPITLKEPTREGYKFLGWYDNAEFAGDPVKIIKDGAPETVYAKWVVQYAISYELIGGVNNAGNPTAYIDGETVTLQDPTRSGYTFEGWYDNADYSGDPVTTVSDGTPAVVYAKWTHYHTFSGPSWTWTKTEDGYVVTATFTCFNCPMEDGSGTVVKDADVTADTDEYSGMTTYTAVVEGPDGNAYENYKTVGFMVMGTYPRAYTGSAITFDMLSVLYDGMLLTENIDYTLKYANNKNAGEASVIVTGKGNYSGTNTHHFTILPLDINGQGFEAADLYAVANNKVQNPVPALKWNGKALKNKTDFTVTYPDGCKDAGTYAITIEGAGNYTGERVIAFEIKQGAQPMSKATVALDKSEKSFVFDGDEKKPAPIVTYNKRQLVKDEDYTVTYSNNIAVGTATVTVTATPENTELVGSKSVTFKITGTPFSKAVVTGINKSYAFSNQMQYPVPTSVKVGADELTVWEDYTIEYLNNYRPGTATMVLTGMGAYSGTKKVTFKIDKCALSNSLISVDVMKDREDGVFFQKGGAKPSLDVTFWDKDSGNSLSLREGIDYTCAYKNNTKLGSATVTLTGKGYYSGTRSESFNVISRELRNAASMMIPEQAISIGKTGYKMSTAMKAPTLIDAFSGKKLAPGTDYGKVITYFYGQNVTLKTGEVEAFTTVNKTDVLMDLPSGGVVIVAEATGTGGYTGPQRCSFRLVPKEMKSIAKLTVKVANKSFTGMPITLEQGDFTFLNGKTPVSLEIWKDFYIVSYSNNIKAGTASVTIQGMGEYSMSKTVSFKIDKKPLVQ